MQRIRSTEALPSVGESINIPLDVVLEKLDQLNALTKSILIKINREVTQLFDTIRDLGDYINKFVRVESKRLYGTEKILATLTSSQMDEVTDMIPEVILEEIYKKYRIMLRSYNLHIFDNEDLLQIRELRDQLLEDFKKFVKEVQRREDMGEEAKGNTFKTQAYFITNLRKMIYYFHRVIVSIRSDQRAGLEPNMKRLLGQDLNRKLKRIKKKSSKAKLIIRKFNDTIEPLELLVSLEFEIIESNSRMRTKYYRLLSKNVEKQWYFLS